MKKYLFITYSPKQNKYGLFEVKGEPWGIINDGIGLLEIEVVKMVAYDGPAFLLPRIFTPHKGKYGGKHHLDISIYYDTTKPDESEDDDKEYIAYDQAIDFTMEFETEEEAKLYYELSFKN